MEGCFSGSGWPLVRDSGQEPPAPSCACGLSGAELRRAESTDGGALRAAHGPGPALRPAFAGRERGPRRRGRAGLALPRSASRSASPAPLRPARPAGGGRCRRPSRELIPPTRLPSPEEPGAARAGPRRARGEGPGPPPGETSLPRSLLPSSAPRPPGRGLRGVGGRGAAGKTLWRRSVCGHVGLARAGAGAGAGAGGRAGGARPGDSGGGSGWPGPGWSGGGAARAGPGRDFRLPGPHCHVSVTGALFMPLTVKTWG